MMIFRSVLASLTIAILIMAAFVPAVAQESDPVDSDLPVLSLDDCTRLALDGSPTLLVSEERRLIASKDVTGAYGTFLPTVSVGYDWRKSQWTDFDVENNSSVTFPIEVVDGSGVGQDLYTPFPTSQPNNTFTDQSFNSTSKGFNGQASLNVFEGMAKFSRLSSAKYSLRSAEANLGYTRELVVEDVANAYFNLLRYQKLLEVALETRDQAAKELERAETYFRLGSAAKSDVLQQRVNFENRRLDVVIADNTVKKAFADLAYSMNRPMAAGFNVDLSVLDTDYDIAAVNSLYQEALSNRLDLESSEYIVEARHKDVTTASSNMWPSLDLFVRYDRSQNDSPYKFGSQESANTTIGYSINWNVFDRLQVWTQRSQAKANSRIAEYQLDQSRLNVQVEIRQLHNSLVEAKERAHVSRETIEQSLEELRLATERFRVGAGTTLDVIVAQANLANSRAQEVQAMCDFLIAETMMNRAVGRLRYPGAVE